MKSQTLPVKRRPVSKGIFKRLHAATGRKQRAATTADDLELDDNSSKISRSLTVIFLFHLVVLGLIFFHQQYLEGHSDVAKSAEDTGIKPLPNTAPKALERGNLPKLARGEPTYLVATGDNYELIASKCQVDVNELRTLNNNEPIRAGQVLKIPARKVVPETVPVAVPLEPQEPVGDGLVEALPVGGAPRAVMVRPAAAKPAVQETASKPAQASGKTHVMKKGDSLWTIAKTNKVSLESLKKANGIKDERKVKVGATIVIP
ncbi:MAG: LysM peptidoglycan-binding domain-containing protein [Luteolibacter sp.]